MKLLVFSDSHGRTASMERAIELERPDHILHLGDCVRDVQKLERFHIPVTQVPGNCDSPRGLPEILTPTFCGKKIYMTHGHLHGVKMTYMRAVYAAMEAEANLLLFGHTHRADCFETRGLWVMNPGACGTGGTYGVVELSPDAMTCLCKRVDD